MRIASEAALAALIFVCPFCLGGVPAWALWPLVALSAVASGAACLAALQREGRVRLPVIGLFLALSAALCLLQLLPLPAALMRLASPPAGETYDFALAPLGLVHARGTTLDPGGTWREVAKHLAYLGAFVSAVELARSRSARRRLVMALGGTGAALALVGFAHRLAGVHALFGVEGLTSAEPPFLTPFVNPNHLAGFLLLSGTACLGLALSSAERPGMWTWGAAYVATGAALLLSLSRGGIGCFVAAQATFVLAYAWFRRKSAKTIRAPGTQRLLWGAVAVVCVGAVGLSIASDDILAELASANTVEKLSHSKIELWPMFGSSAWAFARAGMGRGAFESAFTRFQTRDVEQTFTHPENAVLQLACEFGLPATVLLLAVFGLGAARAVRRRLRREPSALDLALLAGAAGLLLHNLVDFNLEFSACAVALWVALGVVARPDPDAPEAGRVFEFAPRRALAAAGVLAVVALVGVRAGRITLAADERMLIDVLKPGVAAEAVEAAALPAIDRHPADYLLYEMVADVYVAERPYRPREALAFLNRTLFLRPIDAEAHRIAAHALLSLGKRSQAFLEFRLALQAAHVSGQWTVLMDGVSRARTAEELCALVPDEPEWIAHAADQAVARGLKEPARQCLEQSLALHGQTRESVPLLLALARLEAAQGDSLDALDRIAEARKLLPGDVSTAVLEAQVLGGAGRAGDAIAALEPLVSSHPASLELALALGRAFLLSGQTRKAVDALERVRPFVTGNDTRATLLLTEAEAYAQDGRLPQQLEAYRAAARLQPHSPGHHYNAAHVLEALGRSSEALDEIHAGLRIDGPQAAQGLQPWMQALAQKKKDTEDAMRQRSLLQPQ